MFQVKCDTAEYVKNGDGWQRSTSLRALSENVDVGVFLNVDHVGVDDDALIDAALGTGQPSLLMIDASDCFLEAIVERTSETVDRLTDEDVLIEAEPDTTGA